eukprot:7353455-Lingulodinium_polyedra.AAC.1
MLQGSRHAAGPTPPALGRLPPWTAALGRRPTARPSKQPGRRRPAANSATLRSDYGDAPGAPAPP